MSCVGRRIAAPLIASFALLMAAEPLATAFAGEGPEYNGIFEERDPATGAYTPLERITGTYRMKMHAMGFGGASGYIEFLGTTSPVRFHAGDKIEFVVRVASREDDPNTTIHLYSLESKSGGRILPYADMGTMGLTSKQSMQTFTVPFIATKYGDHFFKIIAAQPLPPGEYTLMTAGNNDGFCFSIAP